MGTFKEPVYLVWREHTKVFLTALRSICLRALLTESYCLNRAVASAKDRRSLETSAAVAPGVMIAVAPGFTGGVKTVAERVL